MRERESEKIVGGKEKNGIGRENRI